MEQLLQPTAQRPQMDVDGLLMLTAILIVLVVLTLAVFRVNQYLHVIAKNQVKQMEQAAILNKRGNRA